MEWFNTSTDFCLDLPNNIPSQTSLAKFDILIANGPSNSLLLETLLTPFLKWLGRLVLSVAAIAACWGVWYVVHLDSLSRSADEKPKQKPNDLTVEVVAAREEPIEERINLVGSLEPIAQTEIRSRVNGYVTSLPFELGDRVEQGDTLCLLDDADQREVVSRSEAALNVAKAQLRAKQTEAELAKKNVDRQRALIQNGAGTQQLLDSAEATANISEANVDLEKAQVTEAESALLLARLALDDLKLESPISGFVADQTLDVGDLAKPDVAVVRIVNLDTVQTTVNVIEKDYRKVRVGQQADVQVDAYPDRMFVGKVQRISPVLDPETRTAAVHIDVPNAEQFLKPGMYARVSLRSHQSHTGVMIPIAALLSDDDQPFVYVLAKGESLESDLVEQRKVRTGFVNKRIVEIVDGLGSGDEVITLGNRLVKAGQSVKVVRLPFPGGSIVVEQNERPRTVDAPAD